MFESLFAEMNGLKIAVVGDVMLDTYWWGNVDRISPEAPVPVVVLQNREIRAGGAGNVALNTVALGAETYLFSVTGNDEDGRALTTLLKNNNINIDNVISSNDRITTNKTRVISRSQHMLRLDAEQTQDLNSSDESRLLDAFESFVIREQPAVVIFEDYNKGVLTAHLITQMLNLCLKHNIVTTVDPKRKNFFSYKGATIFKPNLKEVQEALNVSIEDVNESFLNGIHDKLYNKLAHEVSLITLSEKGVYYRGTGQFDIIPTHVRSIADVSGAGDTVIAVASVVYAQTRDVALSAAMANVAGGIVCEEVGTVAINKQKLLAECSRLLKKQRFSFY